MSTASTTIRIPKEMHETLRAIAAEDRSTLQDVLVKALEHYRRERFVLDVNAGYLALREDAAAWRDDLKERSAWDATLADGPSVARPRRGKRA